MMDLAIFLGRQTKHCRLPGIQYEIKDPGPWVSDVLFAEVNPIQGEGGQAPTCTRSWFRQDPNVSLAYYSASPPEYTE